jgi:hypothetical protein
MVKMGKTENWAKTDKMVAMVEMEVGVFMVMEVMEVMEVMLIKL